MKLKEIPRTATFAWSPDPVNPTILTGTAAGTIDANFNAATELELWKLDLLDHSVAGFTASPTARVETDARFHDIAVSGDGKFVVGALENGTVETWGIPDLKSVARNTTTHNGAVKSVAFSSKEPTKFATGGAEGSVYIWNVNDLANPFTPGTTTAQRHDDVESVHWNNTAAQILASGGNKGFTSIWDTRRKREVLHLHYASPTTGQRIPISSVQWHPNHGTKLATASMDDNEPVICIWDLKNVNSPERVLRGHTKGVLSLDWCRQDENLLLSGGRDNATMLWNPQAGEQLGTYPISVEWAFKTQFNPHLPDLFASASFDSKISVQTLQDTSGGTSSGGTDGKPVSTSEDGADYWDSENVMDAVHPSFKLQQPPKWLVRPISASFGFGGKLVVAKEGKVDVKSVSDSALDKELTKKFSEALQTKNFETVVQSKSREPGSGWDLLELLLKGENLPVAEEPLKGKETKAGETDDEDEDEFNIVPPYAPSSTFKLLGSKHPGVVAAILKNDFDSAVSQLVNSGEVGDALLVASFGGPGLIKRAQNAYLDAKAESEAYLRVAWSVASQKPEDFVDHSELEAWPSVLKAVLALNDEAVIKCTTYKLGKRLLDANDRENALKVYLSGKNVGAAASLWLDELPALEKRTIKEDNVTAYIAHVKSLQDVVEKLVVATSKLGLPKLNDAGADRLYSAFRDYADVAAQQGDLELAKLLMDMLPDEYASDKQRVQVATETKSPAKKTTANGRPGNRMNAYSPSPLGNASGAPVLPGSGSIITTGSPIVPGAPGAPDAPAVPGAAVSPAASSLPGVQPPFASKPKRASAVRVGGPAAAASGAASTSVASGSPYAGNPYAPAGVSPAAASVAASNAAAATGANAISTPPIAGGASVPPPPPVGSAPAAAVNATTAPFKGWNDIPELPNNSRRTPTAPTRVAPVRAQALAGPPSASSSPRTSVSHPPPMAGQAPPPPPSSASGAIPGVPPGAGSASVAPPPPASSARPANPYAPKPGTRTTSRAASTSSKPNPYSPSPGSSAPPSAIPSPVLGVRSAPPPRARAAPPPPPVGGVANVSISSPPPPAAAAPPAAASIAPPPPPPAATSTPAPPPASASPAAAPPTAAAPPKTSAKKAENGPVPDHLKPVQSGFSQELQRVRPVIEVQYAKQYNDTARRLEILYGKLSTLSEAVAQCLLKLSESLTERDYESANSILQEIAIAHQDETGEWFTGVRRLMKMSQGVPV